MNWIATVKQHETSTLALGLGFNVNRRTIRPCPVCHSNDRGTGRSSGRPDRRAPVELFGQRWHCYHCGSGGTGFDLVTLTLFQRKFQDLTTDEMVSARTECARRGWCTGEDDWKPKPFDRSTLIPKQTAQQIEPVMEEFNRWPESEVQGLWDSCKPVCDDQQVAHWIESRGIDPGKVEDFDLARILPEKVTLPWWARSKSGSWFDSGHRLLLPLSDCAGKLRAFRARDVTGKAERKELAPRKGRNECTIRGLFYADPVIRQVFQRKGWLPDWWPENVPFELVITEGSPDYLTWCTKFSDAAETAPGILGIFEGSWQLHLEHNPTRSIPAGTKVYVRTDPDGAGARYALKIISELKERQDLEIFARIPAGVT